MPTALIANPSRRYRKGRTKSMVARSRARNKHGQFVKQRRRNPGGAMVLYTPPKSRPKRRRLVRTYYTPPGATTGVTRRVRRRRPRRSYFITRKRRARPRYIAARKTPRRRRLKPMAKRGRRRYRRSRNVIVTPRGRRITRLRRAPKSRARRFFRKHGRTYYTNPRRRRVHRRSNPGRRMGGSLISTVLKPYAVGFIASMGVAAIDTFVAKKFPAAASGAINQLVKVGTAFVVAFALRRKPEIARSAITAIAATGGYNLGSKLVGGMAAVQTPAQALKGIGEMAESYPDMGALLQGGVGALLQGLGDIGPPNTQDVVANYGAALNGMGDDDN